MRGKVVLITGASSGIGAGTAVHFAAKGCLLALTGRNQSGLQDTLQACVRAGAKEDDIILISADLLVFENLAMIVEKTLSKFGKLDVLVNNAGATCISKFESSKAEEFDFIMNTNLKSIFFLTQAAMPHLLESKGSVVNVSSFMSTRPNVYIILYAMSKAALDHFTRTLALDVSSRNVRVNAVNPGGVKTAIIERAGHKYLPDRPPDDEIARRLHAMRRAGTVDEIAKAILFLADNEQSSFVTGTTFLVDGGASLLTNSGDSP